MRRQTLQHDLDCCTLSIFVTFHIADSTERNALVLTQHSSVNIDSQFSLLYAASANFTYPCEYLYVCFTVFVNHQAFMHTV
jgi:hypothetical protein